MCPCVISKIEGKMSAYCVFFEFTCHHKATGRLFDGRENTTCSPKFPTVGKRPPEPTEEGNLRSLHKPWAKSGRKNVQTHGQLFNGRALANKLCPIISNTSNSTAKVQLPIIYLNFGTCGVKTKNCQQCPHWSFAGFTRKQYLKVQCLRQIKIWEGEHERWVIKKGKQSLSVQKLAVCKRVLCAQVSVCNLCRCKDICV